MNNQQNERNDNPVFGMLAREICNLLPTSDDLKEIQNFMFRRGRRRLWRETDPATFLLTYLETYFDVTPSTDHRDTINHCFAQIQTTVDQAQFEQAFEMHVQDRIFGRADLLPAVAVPAALPVPDGIHDSHSDITASTNTNISWHVASGGGGSSLSPHAGSHPDTYHQLGPAVSGSVPSDGAQVAVAGNLHDYQRHVSQRPVDQALESISTRNQIAAFLGEAAAEGATVDEAREEVPPFELPGMDRAQFASVSNDTTAKDQEQAPDTEVDMKSPASESAGKGSADHSATLQENVVAEDNLDAKRPASGDVEEPKVKRSKKEEK